VAQTTQQLEAQLDTIDKAMASPLLSATSSDGQTVSFKSKEGAEAARAHVLLLLGRRRPRPKAIKLRLTRD
jgi:hypothetical protein